MSEFEASRRTLICGLAAAGASLPVLAACGSSSTPAATSNPTDTATSGGSGSGGGAPAANGIPTSEIPVGGGKIFADQNIVITQPTAGQFKAFSAICTHQGCPVTEIQQGEIICTCHGSFYSIKDGSVDGGPAPSPLSPMKVQVVGTNLVVS